MKHAATLLPPDSLLAEVVAKHPRRLDEGAWRADTVAYWPDHIGAVNPYDAVDPPTSRAVPFLIGLTDWLAGVHFPLGLALRDAAFGLGIVAHVVSDLNQPYHVAERHTLDHEEHGRFEGRLQDWALKHGAAPPFPGGVTVPQDLAKFLQVVTLPRSYQRYRAFAGHEEAWTPEAFRLVHEAAIHDILAVWLYLEREVRWRTAVMRRVDADNAEPLDAVLALDPPPATPKE